MKAVILAGGLGTRISEESHSKPKPMIEIGGYPILWHIMKTYAHYGVTDFIILCGYKGFMIKEYFSNYFLHMSDITFDIQTNEMDIHEQNSEPWKVTLLDTGENTMTGGRLKRAFQYIQGEEDFCFTYGDGLSNINIGAELEFHKAHKKLATVAAVQPPGRYGMLDIEGDIVNGFLEKPVGDGGWINGGFFILSPKCIDLIDDDSSSWEDKPLSRLAANGDLVAFKHKGFWQPMDTLREKNYLESLWKSDSAPWKIW
ncbi:glucose-1-phosphate cytidylyltransferase [Gammaproteobacteria bacterium]|nr:glucose-1-phosphate cytidylyltransferase [Gammaproteobacteria bacterium]